MRKPRNRTDTLERSEYATVEDLNDPAVDLLPGRDWAYVIDEDHKEGTKHEREKPRKVRFLP